MTMHDSDLVVEARKALGDIVDQTPMAPEWPEIELDRRRPNGTSLFGLPRGLTVAAASAVGVVAVVGAVALLGGPAADVQGEATTLGPSAPDATAVSVPLERIDLMDQIAFVSATSGGSPGLGVSNLVDGSYEASWRSDGGDATTAELSFGFVQPVYIDSIVIFDLQDETDRLGRKRIKDFEIEFISDSGSTYVSSTAPDSSTPYVVQLGIDDVRLVIIHVNNVWQAETVGGQPAIEELAVAEVEFHGAPVPIDRERIDEIRTVSAELDAAITRLELEIALLEQMRLEQLREANAREAADDIASRIAALKALHAEMTQELATFEELLDNAQ